MNKIVTDNSVPLSVLLVEDAAPVRQRFCRLIMETPGLSVAAEAGTVAEATVLFDAVRPGAVILDMLMPEIDGRETMSVLRRMSPTLPVLAMSGFMEPPFLWLDALTMFLRKPFGCEELTLALQALRERCPPEKA